MSDCERSAGDQQCRPHFQHSIESGEGPDQPEWDQYAEGSQDNTGIRAQYAQINSGHAIERDQRNTKRAECNRRRVGDERKSRGGERTEAQSDQDRRGHCYRSSESRRALKERTKTECNQQKLKAAILGDARERFLKDFELTRLVGQRVHEDDVDDDPADRQEAVAGAIHCGGCGQTRRHMETENRSQQCRGQSEERREMRFHVSQSKAA